jgi:hypothetical protein
MFTVPIFNSQSKADTARIYVGAYKEAVLRRRVPLQEELANGKELSGGLPPQETTGVKASYAGSFADQD